MSNSESIFRVIFLAVLIANVSITAYHRHRAAASGERISRAEEGRILLFLRSVGALALWGSIFAYAFFPASMKWSTFPLPDAWRWLGAVVAALSVPLLYWTLRNLGKNLTDTVFVRSDHTLVTSGPYRWVRHPFYVAAFGGFTGLSLVAANWFFGLMTILLLLIIITRTNIEESRLIERFGEAYRQYMDRTGRFLPKPAVFKLSHVFSDSK